MISPSVSKIAALPRKSEAVPSRYQKETRTGGSIIRLEPAIRKPTTRCTAENPIARQRNRAPTWKRRSTAAIWRLSGTNRITWSFS